jgi:uncharacterized protein (DUF1919 family)
MATEPGVFAHVAERTASQVEIPAVRIETPQYHPQSQSQPAFAGVKALRNRIGAEWNKIGLDFTDFTILSNDCWAQALYEEWGLPCQTPMAGAGMHADCFLTFLGNISGYLDAPLRFASASRHASVNRLRLRRRPWPMAVLADAVEIHFMHHATEEEARRVWGEGCRRVNLDRLAVKFSVEKDGASREHITQFNQMQFDRKLLIGEHSYPGVACALQVPNYVINGAVMFRRSLRHFDCAHWINTGEIRRNSPRVLVNKLLYLRGI